MVLIILVIISLIVSSIIVNGAQNLYMKIIGADGMFFDGRKKLTAIVVIGLGIAGMVANGLGLV